MTVSAGISKKDATTALKDVFQAIGSSLATVPLTVRKPTAGKVYELVVLAEVLSDLAHRGFSLSFSNPGGKVSLKAGPGQLLQSDPHFDVATAGVTRFQVFVSVEFSTLGAHGAHATDLSGRHEIDVGVFDVGCGAYPRHDQIALAVECKAVATLTKALVRGVLGLRRELSYVTDPRPSRLARALRRSVPSVPANPPSEVWLVASDQNVLQYAASPRRFGVECRHVHP